MPASVNDLENQKIHETTAEPILVPVGEPIPSPKARYGLPSPLWILTAVVAGSKHTHPPHQIKVQSGSCSPDPAMAGLFLAWSKSIRKVSVGGGPRSRENKEGQVPRADWIERPLFPSAPPSPKFHAQPCLRSEPSCYLTPCTAACCRKRPKSYLCLFGDHGPNTITCLLELIRHSIIFFSSNKTVSTGLSVTKTNSRIARLYN